MTRLADAIRAFKAGAERLKGELQSLRRKGTQYIGSEEDDNQPPFLGGRACTRCRGELGRIINRGANCPSCNQRVCKSCRHYDTNRWLCLVCYKQMERLSESAVGNNNNNIKLSNDRLTDKSDSANSNIQRSCSFSDVDPPAWSFLRCSPDMRAYSSMPRHRLLDYPPVRIVNEEISEPDVLFEPICRSYQRTATTENTKAAIENTLDVQKCESPDESSPGFGVTPITSPEQSPVIDKRIFGSHASTSAFIRTLNLSFRKREAGHTWYIPPGVTPPRSRRRLNTGDSHDDGEMGTFGDKGLSSDSDDYKLVFISSSDSSSREELGSDDASSTSSGAATGLLEECEWDYECFECWPPLRRETPTESGTVGTDRPQPTDVNSCLASVGQCVPIHVPIPVPFPFPVPVFFPVPFPAPFIKGDEMTTALPDSEIFPIDEALCNKAVSPVLVRDPEEDSVVLKVYKSLDCTDNAVSPTPEDILRLNEARLKDFTDIKDDNSVSSVSSDEDDENRVPSTRTYKLNQSEDDSSSEFNIAASPPKSLTSASSSDDSSEDEQNRPDGPKKPFTRTFVLHESSESENEENTSYELLENDGNEDDGELNATSDLCNDVTVVPSAGLDMSLSTKQNENLVNHKTAKDLLFTESEPVVTDIDVVRKEDNLTSGTHLSRNPEPLSLLQVDNESVETSVEEKLSSSDGIVSIITFSHDEVLQIISEFLSSERNPCRGSESRNLIGEKSEMNLKNSQAEADAALPETRSNTSDEFSGTESMEMPLEDSLECSGLGGEGAVARGVAGESGSSARYTSLVMITQEQGANPPPQRAASDGKVTVVTGGTNSSVVCLEEGLADDDSWVEDLDREDVVTTEESSEEEPYTDREEELRGYHRSAIDFTLHTIAEESCEESESERDNVKPTELEKYFFYGLSDNHGNDDFEEDAMSETSSIFSEGVESSVSAVEEQQNSLEPADLASSRLEKYFLSGFMGFRRDSDGSVGSDSEGRPSPEQRRKRLVRARGTGRQHSNSLDNLNEPSEQSGDNPTVETEGSSTETDSHDEQLTSFEKGDGQFDTVKRTKKKKRSVPSCQSDLLEVPESYGHNDGHSTDDGNKTPQPEPSPSDLLNSRNKQQSRDSGFVGSCDDLLKESRDSNSESPKTEEPSKNTSDEKPSNTGPPAAGLIRKDSFNNWSSDEETNLMMSKMRAFFKTMVASQPKDTTSNVKPKPKPPQLVYFENELTRLMKTVPGLRDEQVREIVEYLSSEDTWSDSYDSSDYTSSDLENGTKRSALQEEISASCRQIISNFETSCNDDLTLPDEPGKESFVYQRLVASLNKMEVPKKENVQNSPLLIEKVMQHIGTRLWALMHEVSGGEGSSPRAARYHKRLSSKISASTTEEEEDSVEDYSPLPRSKSHDPLLEENRQEASDNERFSWRGSFESALMASDSRTRLASGGESSVSASALALAAKRRSAGDLIFKSCSREQLDRVRSCGSIGGSAEDKIWSREQKRRRSSVPDSGGSAGDDDSEEEPGSRATLPRSLQSSCASATNSLPRLPIAPSSSTGTPIYKSHSVHQFNVKSARYRPPGYRNSPLAPPPRRDRNRRNTSASAGNGCDDASICSDPVVRGAEEEVGDELLTHRASLGARSDSMASVYSGAGEGRHGRVAVKGEVQFGLQYNYKLSSLEIRVQSCRDLAAVDAKRNRSDPYVKVYLLPDKSKTGKRKTKVKKHTLNPVFDDILRFQVDMKELESRTLWLSVWHSDMFGRNDFLGEVLMPLENKVYDDPHPKYYTLQERSETLEELSTKGEMIVGLKYDPPDESNSSKKRPSKGTLYVLVKEAKNLPAVKSNGTSDPFCKCYLLPDKGRSTKQKAPVVKKSCNPAWNHTFTYNNVTLEELGERSLELTIWDHDRLASNEFLGGVRLNLGSGNNSGKPVDWMDASGNEVTLWQRMMERPKFWVESCLPLRPSLELRRSHDL